MYNVTPCSRLNACSLSASAAGSAKALHAAAEGLFGRSRPVRRQRQQRRQLLQLLAPVRHLLLEHLALQPAPLPLRVVGVLDRQRRERRVARRSQTPGTGSPARGRGPRATSRPTRCGASSPAARSRPTRGPHLAQQSNPAQPLARQIEVVDALASGAIARASAARHRFHFELEPRRIDHLHGAAIASLEARAQRLVSPMQLLAGSASAPPRSLRHAVATPAACCRPRSGPGTAAGTTAAAAHTTTAAAARATPAPSRRRPAHRRRARAPPHAPATTASDARTARRTGSSVEKVSRMPRGELHRQQRMAAELEEIVMPPDALALQQRAPDLRQQLLRQHLPARVLPPAPTLPAPAAPGGPTSRSPSAAGFEAPRTPMAPCSPATAPAGGCATPISAASSACAPASATT